MAFMGCRTTYWTGNKLDWKMLRAMLRVMWIYCSAPDEAVAIEVKRIKCGANAMATGKPNNLGELENSSSQANRLAKVLESFLLSNDRG
jgi:hypothetical protein